ncbi:MAG: FAD-linked oxidase [bacterium]|nr:MAG: FAD-linked oxidase [bacterium]
MKVEISNWGNYPRIEAELKSFSTVKQLEPIIRDTGELIARGFGSCFGDSSLNKNITSPLSFNRMLSLDENAGTLTCEAGTGFDEILEVLVSRGWFLPVTPGTKFVTLGGAIAADVHGKNHHAAGSFSRHVVSMDVMLYDGSVVSCSRDNNPDLFRTTCGGFGLTGIILRATFGLKKIESAYIKQETAAAKDLSEMMDLFEASSDSAYSAAWLDCLNAKSGDAGRGVMITGEHATRDEVQFATEPPPSPKIKKMTVPFKIPRLALNGYTAGVFNNIYYKRMSRKSPAIVNYNSFFYPVDGVNSWNRIYGKRGFVQYQFVLPKDRSKNGLKKMLGKITNGGPGAYLAVLKIFGKQESFISFPMEGYTLALDFPVTRKIFGFLKELDKIVLDFGGRLYLAKDARMNSEMFSKSYENSEKFIELKHGFDPVQRFQSLQSKRLGI